MCFKVVCFCLFLSTLSACGPNIADLIENLPQENVNTPKSELLASEESEFLAKINALRHLG